MTGTQKNRQVFFTSTLIFLTALSLSSGRALAAETTNRITFKAVSDDGKPVGARVYVIAQGNETEIGDYVPPAALETTAVNCQSSIMVFKAEPKAFMSYRADPNHYACSYGNITFHFQRYEYASIVDRAVSFDYMQFSGRDPAFATLQSGLTDAIKSTDSKRVMVIATDLAARLRHMGQSRAAGDTSVLAYQAAAQALGVSEPLEFDAKQESFVLSDKAVAAIKSYQISKSIAATGKLDWTTMDVVIDNKAYEAISKCPNCS